MKDLKFSICVPVFNVERYLNRCLESLVNQTYKNFEIICVEDGSTDNSPKLLDDFAKTNENVIVIKHDGNRGLLQARRTAVEKATGDYILFVDSDDSLELNALEVIAQNLEKSDYDIFAFGYKLKFECIYEKQKKKLMETFYLTPNTKKKGDNIFKMCFLKNEIPHNVIGKAFKADLCKKVYADMIDGNIVMSEDLYGYMKLTFFAKTFKSISKKLYNYTIGTGVSTKNTITIGTFEKTLKSLALFDDLEAFLKKNNAKEFYYKGIESWKNKVFEDCFGWFVKHIQKSQKVRAFELLVEYYGKDRVFYKLAKDYFWDQDYICEVASKSKAVEHDGRKIKTVGFFYYRIGNGGVERVIEKLIPYILKLGYKVVCFVEKEPDKDSYELPKGVKIEVVPNSIRAYGADYVKHAEGFEKALKKHNVDLMLYQAYSSENFGFDALLCRLNGVYVVPTFHGVLLYAMHYLCGDFLRKTKYYMLCDTMHVLTSDEEAFWQAYGYKTKYIPNPLTFDVSKTKTSNLDSKKCLWLARLDSWQKQPEIAIEIFRHVVAKVPDAELLMVGKAESKQYEEKLKKMVEGYHLQNNITFVGYTKNVGEYYAKASVFLMTSAFEAYPMVLGEAMSYGLPCVMLDLPYVEMTKNNDGIAIVAQDDLEGCADKIVKILTDDELRKNMGKASREYLEKLSQYNIMQDWKDLIDDLPNGNRVEIDDKFAKIIPVIPETCFFNPYARKTSAKKVSLVTKFKWKVHQIGLFPTLKLCFKYIFHKR